MGNSSSAASKLSLSGLLPTKNRNLLLTVFCGITLHYCKIVHQDNNEEAKAMYRLVIQKWIDAFHAYRAEQMWRLGIEEDDEESSDNSDDSNDSDSDSDSNSDDDDDDSEEKVEEGNYKVDENAKGTNCDDYDWDKHSWVSTIIFSSDNDGSDSDSDSDLDWDLASLTSLDSGYDSDMSSDE